MWKGGLSAPLAPAGLSPPEDIFAKMKAQRQAKKFFGA